MAKERTVEDRARDIREEATRYSDTRLSRGSLRMQDGAYALEREWQERRSQQSKRLKALKEKLRC